MNKSVFALILVFVTQVFAADQSELCSQTTKNTLSYNHQVVPRPQVSGEFTIVTWNAHKYADKNFFIDLKTISEVSDVIFLQEAMHSDDWQSAFLNNFPFSFTFYKSFCNNSAQATGVQSAARYPLENNLNLISPGKEPITNTPKVSGISRIQIPGFGYVLLVNTHALNFNSGGSFEGHIDQIANYISSQSGPVIWAGDFNTWNSNRQKYLNQKTKALGLLHVIPAHDDRQQVLDHIFVRGLKFKSAEILNRNTSDHKPLTATFLIK